MTEPPRLRADAARNRQLVLAAAEAEFAERGLDVSVSDIARRAGVGKGTVFRHFATKDDLIAAIVGKDVGALIAAGERLLEAADPGNALLEFLTEAGGLREQRDVSFLLNANDAGAEVTALRGQLYRTVGALVDRARDHGALRPDVTGTDVILLMCTPNYAVGHLRDPAPGLWRRYVGIIFDGLRPEAAHPLGQPAPTLPWQHP